MFQRRSISRYISLVCLRGTTIPELPWQDQYLHGFIFVDGQISVILRGFIFAVDKVFI